MKVNIEKLHDKFNKAWIGHLYVYSIFMIFASFGAIVGLALGFGSMYFWLMLVVIGYVIVLPIGIIRDYIRKNYKEEV